MASTGWRTRTWATRVSWRVHQSGSWPALRKSMAMSTLAGCMQCWCRPPNSPSTRLQCWAAFIREHPGTAIKPLKTLGPSDILLLSYFFYLCISVHICASYSFFETHIYFYIFMYKAAKSISLFSKAQTQLSQLETHSARSFLLTINDHASYCQ